DDGCLALAENCHVGDAPSRSEDGPVRTDPWVLNSAVRGGVQAPDPGGGGLIGPPTRDGNLPERLTNPQRIPGARGRPGRPPGPVSCMVVWCGGNRYANVREYAGGRGEPPTR